MRPDQENLKLQESVIEFPVTIAAKADEIVEGVHNRDRCIEREGCQRTLMANFNVFVIPALNAPIKKSREVMTASVLP